MKKNYIQPQSENVTFSTGEDIALTVGFGEGSVKDISIDSNKKDWEDDLDWDDDIEE